MNHDDHVRLLRPGVRLQGGTWADFGSGGGAFTLALAELLGPNGTTIYSVDRDPHALRRQEEAMRSRFPATRVHYVLADFTQPLDLPLLDGAVMANALHFQRDQLAVLRVIAGYLRPGGTFLLVEYNTERGNHWIPYPVSYARWRELAPAAGLADVAWLGSVPSRFAGEIYAAVATVPG